MPHLMTEGVITNGKKLPMYVLAQLVTQGNGIAVSGSNAGKGLGLDISSAAEYIKNFQSTEGRKLTAAHLSPRKPRLLDSLLAGGWGRQSRHRH